MGTECVYQLLPLPDRRIHAVRPGATLVAIASRQYLFPIADGQFKLSTCHVGSLSVVMFMQRTDRSFLKFYLDHHQLSVVSHYLTTDSRSGVLPFQLFLKLKNFTTRFSYSLSYLNN